VNNVSTQEVLIKIVLIGDGAVGKTSIAKRYLGKEFEHEYIMTIGVDFFKKRSRINIENVGEITFLWHIWDLSGQPHWKHVRPAFYRGARGALLVFDVSNRESYNDAPEWGREFVRNSGKYPLVLVGNKIDLRDSLPDCITYEEGLAMAKKISEELGIDVPYIETSAKEGINIDEAFRLLAQLVFTRILEEVKEERRRRSL